MDRATLLIDTLIELDRTELGRGIPLDVLFNGVSPERALAAALAAGYRQEQARAALAEVYGVVRLSAA